MISANEPRDTESNRKDGICLLCGLRAYNGDRVQDEEGRDYHEQCLTIYLIGHSHERIGS